MYYIIYLKDYSNKIFEMQCTFLFKAFHVKNSQLLYYPLFLNTVIRYSCISDEEPPLITSNFEESYYMKEEDDTPKTFQCSSSGNPAPT